MDLKEASPFKNFFEPIGELVIASSMLETHLSNTIQMLIGITPEDKALLMEQILSMRSRIAFFEASLNTKLKEPDALDWTKDIANDLRRANTHRNRIVHGPWNDFDSFTGEATKLRFKGEKQYLVKQYKYTKPQIEEIASKMFSIMTRMGFLMGHFLHRDVKLGARPGVCMPDVG